MKVEATVLVNQLDQQKFVQEHETLVPIHTSHLFKLIFAWLYIYISYI